MIAKLWWTFRTWMWPKDFNSMDDGVYQGGAVNDTDFDSVLSLMSEVEDRFKTIKAFTWMPIEDNEYPGDLWLTTAVRIVETYRAAGWTVLIHCMQGKSRSGMVNIAYHMKKNNWSFEESYAYVKQRRPITEPNPKFVEGLKKWTW